MPGPREATRREAARRWLVRLVFAFYAALLGEGVLRKWVVPEASDALVFLRDPIMALILCAYLRMGVSDRSRAALAAAGLALLVLVLCAACQAGTTDLSPLVLLAGLRNYAFFVPLSFAIGDGFAARDYRAWVLLNLLVAGPVALLVVLQYAAPPTAALNAVPGGGNEGVFLVVDGVVRPYGLFSFALGHSSYAAWMAGLALAAVAGGRSVGVPRTIALVGVAAVLVMGLLSGSRTYVLLALAVILGFAVVAGAFGPLRVRFQALGTCLAVLLGAGAVLLAIPSVASNLIERQSEAVASEGSTVDRLGEVLGGFVGEAAHVPAFGAGLGSGTNIAAFLANGRTDHVLAEYELTRIVQELGPWFGGAYILLRWTFLAWLIALTIGAARRGNLQPACFIGFVAPVFLAHDITLQNTMIGIGWFAAGIVIAAARVGGEPVPATPVCPSPALRETGA